MPSVAMTQEGAAQTAAHTPQKTFEEVLVAQAAPTLAGLKPASLFSYWGTELATARRVVQAQDQALAGRGVHIAILKQCPETGRLLIYAYREKQLLQVLHNPACRAFLGRAGYALEDDTPVEDVLRQLAGRICLCDVFPHEIGVFLGYPLEDVEGFIDNKGRNFTCCGTWKVYGDAEAARRRFALFERCTAIYQRVFQKGRSLTQLTVAA